MEAEFLFSSSGGFNFNPEEWQPLLSDLGALEGLRHKASGDELKVQFVLELCQCGDKYQDVSPSMLKGIGEMDWSPFNNAIRVLRQ